MNQRFGFCHDCKNKDHCRKCYRGSWYESDTQSSSISDDDRKFSRKQEIKETNKQQNKFVWWLRFLFSYLLSRNISNNTSIFQRAKQTYNVQNNKTIHQTTQIPTKQTTKTHIKQHFLLSNHK